MSLTTKEIKEILAILEASGWDEAEVTIGDTTLTVSKGGGTRIDGASANGASAAAAPPEIPATPDPEPAATAPAPPMPDGVQITAPSVGIFWRAPEPGAAPYVSVGDAVEPGETVCIVEVMKLMQHVAADVGGEVVAIHQENGDHVEYGQALFTIAPSA